MPLQPDFDETILRVLQKEAGYPAATASEALESLRREFRKHEEVGSSAAFPIANVSIRLSALADAALDGRLPSPPEAFPGSLVLAVLRWLDGMIPVRGEFREGEPWEPTPGPHLREAAVCLALRERERSARRETGTIPGTDADRLSLRVRELLDGYAVEEIGAERGAEGIGAASVVEAMKILEDLRCLETVGDLRTVARTVTVQEFDEY